ncbi:EAL and HDOD domain-containing protein [Paraburkholderia phytofirmans]|uniref:EAL and HDOD domain-containing protein n=1 Tax=Paraburkholderia phytofirmans TaxID=261302 RepID=UPI0013147DE5|nr:EAL domain-containing protein [Paraburkholderia phytofirmans]
MSDSFDVVAPDRFMLELPPDLHVDETLLQRLAELRAKRYRFVLDAITRPDETFALLLPFAEAIKIDVSRCHPETQTVLVRALKARGKTLIALKVETMAAFEATRKCGFDLFQGYFFAHPEILTTRRVHTPRHSLLRLLRLIELDPSLTEIEAELKRVPALTTHVMRMANLQACRHGPTSSTTLRDAISAIGTSRLGRWAQLLLYADDSIASLEHNPLAQLALTRARFMELAVDRMPDVDADDAECAFLTGVLSLVEAASGDSLDHTIRDFPVSDTVRAALLRREGVLGTLLSAIEALELGNWDRFDCIAEQIASPTTPNLAELAAQAAVWAGSADQSLSELERPHHGMPRSTAASAGVSGRL